MPDRPNGLTEYSLTHVHAKVISDYVRSLEAALDAEQYDHGWTMHDLMECRAELAQAKSRANYCQGDADGLNDLLKKAEKALDEEREKNFSSDPDKATVPLSASIWGGRPAHDVIRELEQKLAHERENRNAAVVDVVNIENAFAQSRGLKQGTVGWIHQAAWDRRDKVDWLEISMREPERPHPLYKCVHVSVEP